VQRPLTVDVVLDLTCPWCWLGERRLGFATLALRSRFDVRVRRRPFELHPELPAEGAARAELRAATLGETRAKDNDRRVTEALRREGIEVDLERVTRLPNTFEAHRLVWYAGKKGQQDAIVEALFRAYFVAGRDLGSHEVLVEVGTAAGLDETRLRKLFASATGVETVRNAEARARGAGVTALPCYIIDGRFALEGAQTVQALADALERAANESTALEG